MLKLAYLTINPHYDEAKFGKYNSDFACFVIETKTDKVVKVGVVRRELIGQWYQGKLVSYPPRLYTYFIATLSILGEIQGVDEVKGASVDTTSVN